MTYDLTRIEVKAIIDGLFEQQMEITKKTTAASVAGKSKSYVKSLHTDFQRVVDLRQRLWDSLYSIDV